jgi:transcriptional regulator with XRE-family HTH domain
MVGHAVARPRGGRARKSFISKFVWRSERNASWSKVIWPDGQQGNPNPIDVHVGSRVRLRRTLLGMSQEKLGDAIGLTFQQVQKYERGTNRVGSSRLFDRARVLDVPVSFFFDEMSASTSARSPGRLRAYYRITDPRVRKRVFELTKSMAKNG